MAQAVRDADDAPSARAAVRSRFRRLGVSVVEWRHGDPLEPVLEEVSAFRRYARAMRA